MPTGGRGDAQVIGRGECVVTTGVATLLLVKIAGAGDTRSRRCGSLTGIVSVSADATLPGLQENPPKHSLHDVRKK